MTWQADEAEQRTGLEEGGRPELVEDSYPAGLGRRDPLNSKSEGRYYNWVVVGKAL